MDPGCLQGRDRYSRTMLSAPRDNRNRRPPCFLAEMACRSPHRERGKHGSRAGGEDSARVKFTRDQLVLAADNPCLVKCVVA
jgi:hypothetical protein